MTNKKDSSSDFTHFLKITVISVMLSVPFWFIAPSVAAVAFMIILVSLNAASNKKRKGKVDGGSYLDHDQK
ncbi:hypothetical protein [Chitinophaga sp.]|uniref:hypothetical protein n=1 Tax=Chitinophaga sp. TaxID=1869181 RepID=UPI0031DB4518